MTESGREYRERTALGLCGQSGCKHDAAPGRRRCAKHLEMRRLEEQRRYASRPGARARRYHARREAGVCVECQRPPVPRRARCLACQERMRRSPCNQPAAAKVRNDRRAARLKAMREAAR